jgi:tetratricopeptide (TPR) repeat protein
MPEQQSNRSPQLRVSARPASGEQPAVRAPPKPARRHSGSRPAAPRPELASAPEITSELLDAFGAEESPTVALSQPVLSLLVRETAAAEMDEVPTVSMRAAMPVTDSVAARTTPEPAGMVMELEETAVRARSRVPVGTQARTRRPTVRALALAAAFVFAATALGALGWRYYPLVKSWVSERAARPAATLPAPAVRGMVEVASAAEPEQAAAQAPVPLPPSAGESSPTASSVLAVPLLAADGSEASVATCESLLHNLPADNRQSFDHVRAGRKAFVRGDVEGSQRSFCQAVRANSADPTASFELAQLLLLRRDGAAAAHWAQQAARLESRSSRVLELLGDAAIRAGDGEQARKAWLGAAKLEDNDHAGIERLVQATLDAANASLKERDPARAERLLRRVVALRPDNAAVHAKLAAALGKLGFTKSAELWAQRAAELGLSAPQ